ncbi:hypothetical protein [Hymenobacter metallicola]|uniref:Uncharacterized protein n=1 Tax=Hymenobacter metallicola TaxID=2563114 RepID=A0A4Z0PZE4_9BACT|nr:hypothetical protein [Hymenobacter metallicola]TGE22805.1 hypothetical protein E5K02_20790 [Hymenobacter metallicola]
METPSKFEAWAILEIMGHVKLAGKVSETTIAGAPLLRVDVPATDVHPEFTRFYGASSIYCLTPVSEEVATLAAKRMTVNPINVYMPEIQPLKQLAARRDDEEAEEECEQCGWAQSRCNCM